MLNHLLYDSSLLVCALVVIGSVVLFGVLGQLLVHRLVPDAVRHEHIDVIGIATDTVGVVYAVLLAFIATEVWVTFNKADDAVTREASLVGYLYVDARLLPEPLRGELGGLLDRYVDTVLKEEWPAMRRGERPGIEGAKILAVAYVKLAALRSQDPIQVTLFGEALGRLNALADARRARIGEAEDVLQPVVWAVLLAGGGITLAFCWLFGFRHRGWHLASTALVSGSIGLMILLIVIFDYPFRGAVHVTPEAFERLTETVRAIGLDSAN